MRAAITLCLVASVTAFAPLIPNTCTRPLSLPRLHALTTAGHEEKQFSKRQIVAKVVKRTAGTLGTIALATSAFPAASLAAKQAAAPAKVALKVNPDVVKAVGVFVGGSVVALLGRWIFGGAGKNKATISKIESAFPGALKHKDLISKVYTVLKKQGYGKKTSLVATSFDPDEVNRALERGFADTYDITFHMGGLTGFPFGGVTAFGAMASHIPDGGSCLVVFGPNVGVDSKGVVGTVERRGRAKAGPCCESAVAALDYVTSVNRGDSVAAGPPKVPTDAQKTFVGNMLLPYAGRLEAASDKMVELPFALFDAQKKMMMDIVKAGCGNVAGKGKIAVLGGIQINTPEGTMDSFKPMSFELYDNSGTLLEDLSGAL